MDKELRKLLYGKLKKLIARKLSMLIFKKVVGGWRLMLIEFAVNRIFPAVIAGIEFLHSKGLVLFHTRRVKKQLEKLNNAETFAEFDTAFDELN